MEGEDPYLSFKGAEGSSLNVECHLTANLQGRNNFGDELLKIGDETMGGITLSLSVLTPLILFRFILPIRGWSLGRMNFIFLVWVRGCSRRRTIWESPVAV